MHIQSDALADFEAAGGYNVDEKIASVLTGLGFLQKDFKKSCAEFSGKNSQSQLATGLAISEKCEADF